MKSTGDHIGTFIPIRLVYSATCSLVDQDRCPMQIWTLGQVQPDSSHWGGIGGWSQVCWGEIPLSLLKKNFSIISRLFCLSLVTNCCIYEIFLHFVYFIGLNIAFQDWKVHVLSERLSEQNNIPSREKRRPQCDSTLNIKPVFLVDAVSFSSSVVAMWYKWCRMEVNCSVPVYVINAIVGHCWFVEVDRTVDCLFIQSYYMLEGIVNWGTWCV